VKLYEITLKPASGFGTSLKGDTLFGHFCWQAAYDPTLLNGGLGKWIDCYEKKPFLVFSSAWPKFFNGKTRYAFKRPDLPLSYLFRDPSGDDKKSQMSERKKNQSKKWMLLDKNLSLSLNAVTYVTAKGLAEIAWKELTEETRRIMGKAFSSSFLEEFTQPHNTINRLTMTTGEGMFAPFSQTSFFYYPETKLAVFVLIDDDATEIERVNTALERIGQRGYGRDASTGLGKFGLGEHKELPIPKSSSPNACYVLSPVVPGKRMFKEHFFVPFVRFGKHGDILAKSSNPFKNPVIMADEGAVFVTEDNSIFQKPYIGRGVVGISKAMPQSVVQGYSIYLPFKLEI